MTQRQIDSEKKEEFSAPVRICLSGEDLDWLGFKCCCLAINLRTRVSFNKYGNPYRSTFVDKIWPLIIQNCGDKSYNEPPDVSITNEAPIASGLSSSTSLIIALIKAWFNHINQPITDPYRLAELAFNIEYQVIGCGGMDQLTISYGGTLLMQGKDRDLPDILGRIKWPEEYGLLLIDSGQPKSTKEHIAEVRTQIDKKDKNLNRYISITDNCSEQIWEAIEKRQIERLTLAINHAHEAMRDYQNMSTGFIETLRDMALNNGCQAVKLTGAGGGGCLFAVVSESKIIETLNKLRTVYQKHKLPAKSYIIKPDNIGSANA